MGIAESIGFFHLCVGSGQDMGLSNHKSMFSRGENINQRRLRLTRARPNFAADGPDVVLRVGRPTLGANNQMKGIRNNKMAIIPYTFHRH